MSFSATLYLGEVVEAAWKMQDPARLKLARLP